MATAALADAAAQVHAENAMTTEQVQAPVNFPVIWDVARPVLSFVEVLLFFKPAWRTVIADLIIAGDAVAAAVPEMLDDGRPPNITVAHAEQSAEPVIVAAKSPQIGAITGKEMPI